MHLEGIESKATASTVLYTFAKRASAAAGKATHARSSMQAKKQSKAEFCAKPKVVAYRCRVLLIGVAGCQGLFLRSSRLKQGHAHCAVAACEDMHVAMSVKIYRHVCLLSSSM